MPPAEAADFETALVRDFDSIAKVTASIDMQNAIATNPADRDMIFGWVRESVGFLEVNKVAIGALREWLTKAGKVALARLPAAERGTSALINSVAKLLLDNGAQWEDGMHIVLAAHGSNADFIRYLCSLGADPNYMCPTNWTPLLAASRGCTGSGRLVAALLDCGADPNISIAPEDEESQRVNPPTPLMCAAIK